MQANQPANQNTEFPQRRNGVSHPTHGFGVVTQGRASANEKGECEVKFDTQDKPIWISMGELTSAPHRSESPDPKYSRNSGWVGGSDYRKGR